MDTSYWLLLRYYKGNVKRDTEEILAEEIDNDVQT